MIDCLVEGTRMRRNHYHALELPTAQLCSIHANLNRDEKKQRRSYTPNDFCFFIDREIGKPSERAGMAYMRLLKSGRLPPWAMFCFADFKDAEPSASEPDQIALIGEQFLLLTPSEISGGFCGLMLAEHAVSGQPVEVVYFGESLTVMVPTFDDFVIAKADAEVDLVRTHEPHVSQSQ